MKLRFFAFLMLVFPLAGFSQNETFKGEHFIEVTGTALQEIEPNEIYFFVRLREFEENKEKTPLEKLDKEFLNAVKEAGIERSRLEIADAGSQLGKIGKRDKDAFRMKTYQIKLTSASELENLVAKLHAVKVDYADVIRVHHSDLEKIKLDLKVKALQTAKAKAEFLLKSIGSEVGKPLMVREWDMDPIHPMPLYENTRMMNKSEMSQEAFNPDDAQIGFRKIRLQTQVVAQFEIK